MKRIILIGLALIVSTSLFSQIDTIQNNESGYSVRQKLNQTILQVNSLVAGGGFNYWDRTGTTLSPLTTDDKVMLDVTNGYLYFGDVNTYLVPPSLGNLQLVVGGSQSLSFSSSTIFILKTLLPSGTTKTLDLGSTTAYFDNIRIDRAYIDNDNTYIDVSGTDMVLTSADAGPVSLLDIVANTAKATNVPTTLTAGTVNATTYGITSDGSADDIILPEATTSTAGLLGADKWDEIVANTLKVTNATHLGEVTGATTLTIADDIIEAANLEATNSPTDDYIPSYDAASGGFTWVENAFALVSYTSCAHSSTTNINIGTTAANNVTFSFDYIAERNTGAAVQKQFGNIMVLYDDTSGSIYYSSEYIGPDIGFDIQADQSGGYIRLNIIVDNSVANNVSFDENLIHKFYE